MKPGGIRGSILWVYRVKTLMVSEFVWVYKIQLPIGLQSGKHIYGYKG